MSILLSTPNSNGWTKDEKEHISNNYRFSFQAPFKNEVVVSATQLLDDETLLNYLDQTGPRIGAKQRPVTASLFFKRYAYCSLTSSLFGMTILNKSFDMNLHNVYLIDHASESMWLPSFTLKDASAHICAGSREDWRSSVLESLFKENISVMLNHVAHTARISKATLWENAWIYIRWVYETWLGEDHPADVKQRIQDDYAFLLNAPAFHFGLSKNPFQRFAPSIGGTDFTKIRKTCCLYYKTENGTCCKTCPKR